MSRSPRMARNHMNYQRLVEKREAAAATETFLDLAGWKTVIHPALLRHRAQLLESLFLSELGQPQVLVDKSITPSPAIAGRIAGIDDVINTITDIIRAGESATKQLLTSQQTPSE